MSTLHSIVNTLPIAKRGKRIGDRIKIFLVIAFETTAFANIGRRARLRRQLQLVSKDKLLTIDFVRDMHLIELFKVHGYEISNVPERLSSDMIDMFAGREAI